MSDANINKGFLYAVLAYSVWGLLPLYWKALARIDAFHVLAFRIIMTMVAAGIILLARKSYAWLRVFREPKKAVYMLFTSLILTFNWGLYIWAVNRGHALDASLGYYINPLISVLLGLLFFRERLLPLQWAAAAIAFMGVIIITVFSGSLPWISLALAFSFAIYGMLKKTVPLPALESLGAETLAGIPFGVLLLLFNIGTGEGVPALTGFRGLAYLAGLPVHTWVLAAMCGVASALPLYLFARGAKLLPLSAMGFAQFISPTLQFILGVFVFNETFLPHYMGAFACIWAAVIIYIISLRKPAHHP